MIEMIEPTVPATTEQPAPQPTQGVFMDNFAAPNLVGIIMQALEQHIEAMVDKRFNERMNDLKDPSIHEIKDIMTEMFDEMLEERLDDKLTERMEEHTNEYDHDEYDQCVRDVENAGLDDFEEKIKDTLRGLTITLDV
jgi:nucleotidyltransferase/DNA polymerase involved in DNA repair